MQIDYEVWICYTVDIKDSNALIPAGTWWLAAREGGADDAVRILRTWVLDPKTKSARIDIIVS